MLSKLASGLAVFGLVVAQPMGDDYDYAAVETYDYDGYDQDYEAAYGYSEMDLDDMLKETREQEAQFEDDLDPNLSPPCTGGGDPHTWTFDRVYYHGQTWSNWVYAVTGCEGRKTPVQVELFYQGWPPNRAKPTPGQFFVSVTTGMRVRVLGRTLFEAKERNAATLNGRPVGNGFYNQNGQQVPNANGAGGWVVQYTRHGHWSFFNVFFNGKRAGFARYAWGSYHIQISRSYQGNGQVCGVCGYYNADKRRDLENCDGTFTDITGVNHWTGGVAKVNKFVDSWIVGARCGKQPPPVIPQPLPPAQAAACKRTEAQLTGPCLRAYHVDCRCPKANRAEFLRECREDGAQRMRCRFQPQNIRKALEENVKECKEQCE